MKCIDAIKLFTPYVEKSLASSEAADLEQHIAECAKCREEINLVEKAYSVIHAEKEETLNPFISTRILETIKSGNKRGTRHVRLRKVYLGALVAASLLLGIFAGIHADKYTYSSGTENPDNLVLMNDMASEKIEWFLLNE